jgi:hypothetical protein
MKLLKRMGLLTLIMVLLTAITVNAASDQTCTVVVKYKNGVVAASVKVSTSVSGGLSCIGGRDFYTDKDGEVTLKWVEGCYLKKVFVKGDGYEVDYKSGGSYTLYLTVN